MFALLNSPAVAGVRLDLTHHWAGYAAIAVFVIAYAAVAAEEKLKLRKSKPVLVAAGLIWILIGIAYRSAGDLTSAAAGLRSYLGEYAELFLFILVAMTFVNTMEERQLFDALRAWLVRRRLSFRSIFWVTGVMAFFISGVLDNLTTALVMGTVVITVGRGHAAFVGVACINIVVAANAGGAFTPFGDITTLMVWQSGHASFANFFSLFLPALVNWFVPALLMSFAVPHATPAAVDEKVAIRTGAFGVVAIFAGTIALTVTLYNFLRLPPALGMTTGLGVLKLYGYYLHHRSTKRAVEELLETGGIEYAFLGTPALELVGSGAGTGARHHEDLDRDIFAGETEWLPTPEFEESQESEAPADEPLGGLDRPADDRFDIFEILRRAEWDTLLFFYGIILCVGGLAFLGYLERLSALLYHGAGPTAANAAVGVISAVVDNIPVMFAVLSMNPTMGLDQWLLVTLTAGVGGSMLAIGSAAGVALLGQARGQYTFGIHLRWTWAIALGYAASIGVHLLLNG